MRFTNNLARINDLDLLNTVNGGVSMTYVDVVENDRNMLMKVFTPGLEPYSYRIQIINNILNVYGYLGEPSEDGVIRYPSFVRSLPIPYFVDTDKIDAVFDEKELKVYLPYNDKYRSGPKDVEIKY
jgi:HSP20 family protein